VKGRERGFTVLEVTFAVVLFAALLGAAVLATAGDKGATRLLTGAVGPELRCRQALEWITSEMRMASLRGEDRNANGALDEGEDSNGNGVFDSDWDLADGAKDQATLTFNRRVDLKDAEGEVATVAAFSRPVTYRVEDNQLVRLWRRTDESGGETVHRSVLASRVAALRFSRTGSVVRMEIEYLLPKGYESDTRVVYTSVFLRD
jgi:hypothetical protein